MKYMGSKNRIAKYILPLILKDRTDNQTFVDVFCGGLNISDKVNGNVIANDSNKYLIAMWRGLQNDKPRPHTIDKELYKRARLEWKNNTTNEFDIFELGWIGWMASFNGKFFDGGYSGKHKNRDYVDEQIRNTEKQLQNIKNIKLITGSYKDLVIPDNSIIYCDPPYSGTTKYTTSKSFNHDEFWEWCKEKKRQGHKIFISEYTAPKEFICIWERVVTNSMSTKKTYKPTEKLYTL